jgi:hypothetical protein
MAEARIVKLNRHRHAQRAVLYDDELDLRSIEDFRAWAAHGVDFVNIDSEKGRT